jgi:hypothetical protein
MATVETSIVADATKRLDCCYDPGLEKAGLNSCRRYASKALVQAFLKSIFGLIGRQKKRNLAKAGQTHLDPVDFRHPHATARGSALVALRT